MKTVGFKIKFNETLEKIFKFVEISSQVHLDFHFNFEKMSRNLYLIILYARTHPPLFILLCWVGLQRKNNAKRSAAFY